MARDTSSRENWRPIAGRDLRHLPDRRHALDPGKQRVLEGRGDRQRGQRARQPPFVAHVLQLTALQHGFEQLLQKQRHAVRLRDEQIEKRLG